MATLDIIKHLEFFNPTTVDSDVHVIGVGAVGSYIALQLAKLGVKRVHLWDFDTVEEHNIPNQVYTQKDLGRKKTEAIRDHMLDNNPEMEIVLHEKYEAQPISGYVFMEVDSVELRLNILEINEFNKSIKYVFDGRIGLATGQVFSIDWHNSAAIENYRKLCSFKDSDADVAVSACGTTLSVAPSVLLTAAEAVASFINAIKGEKVSSMTMFDAFTGKMRSM